MTRVCQHCGADIGHRDARAVYCGPVCRRRHNSALWDQRHPATVLPDRPCDACGQPFTPVQSTQRFCTDQCRRVGVGQGHAVAWFVDRAEDVERRYRAALQRIRRRDRPLDVWAQPVSYAARTAACGPQMDDDERWT